MGYGVNTMGNGVNGLRVSMGNGETCMGNSPFRIDTRYMGNSPFTIHSSPLTRKRVWGIPHYEWGIPHWNGESCMGNGV